MSESISPRGVEIENFRMKHLRLKVGDNITCESQVIVADDDGYFDKPIASAWKEQTVYIQANTSYAVGQLQHRDRSSDEFYLMKVILCPYWGALIMRNVKRLSPLVRVRDKPLRVTEI